MFFKKIYFFSIISFFSFFLFLPLEASTSQNLSDAAQAVQTMINDLQSRIQSTIENYNENIAYAAVLLDEIKVDLDKIVFIPWEPSSGTLEDIFPASIATLFQELIDENNDPEWVKVARMSSPTIKVVRAPVACGPGTYIAKPTLDSSLWFLLKEKDHTMVITHDILYGYDALGSFFIQELNKERTCTSSA